MSRRYPFALLLGLAPIACASGADCLLECGEGGTCVFFDGEPHCSCEPGYPLVAGRCAFDPCAAAPCVHGTCRADARYALCECEPGYAGAACDSCAAGFVPEGLGCVPAVPCTYDPCRYGTCALIAGAPVCQCWTGYMGELCDSCAPGFHVEALRCVADNSCDPDPCVFGHCSVAGGRAECACEPGYVGERCDACADGFHEEELTCQPDVASVCVPNPCAHGLCLEEGSAPRCACDPGWAGTACDGCAEGYVEAAGACLPDPAGPCGEDPCTGAHRTVCTVVGGVASCSCDAGYQDHDSDGTCAPTCALAALACGSNACDDSSGTAECRSVRSCATVVTYDPNGESITALYLRGEHNGWALSTPMTRQPDGTFAVSLTLPAGDYAYKLFDQGRARWLEDPKNPYFKWIDGQRNSRLHVGDCDQPLFELTSSPTVTSSSLSFSARFVPGQTGTAADWSTLSVTCNGSSMTPVIDPVAGFVSVASSGLARGKYTYRLRLRDLAGRSTEPLFVPLWVEPAPFDWRDAVLYFALTDRFADGNPANNAATSGVDARANWQGGDFAGLRAQIEAGYFDALGVNAIWISSVVTNTTGAGRGSDGRLYSGYHAYWPTATGWREGSELSGVTPIEPHFGTLAELQALVRAAHARGIRVLVDLVANHVHTDSPLWQAYGHQTPAWFYDDPVYVCGWDRPIECWFADYLPDFDYRNLDVLDAVVEHAVWLAQEVDVDGFRLDAVKHMIHDTGFALRARLEEEVALTGNRFYMVGETFTGEDGRALIKEYVRPEELDGQFDFPLYWQVVKTFLRHEQDFRPLESMLQGNAGYYGDFAVMSNFLGNHDVARALTHASGQIADMWGNGAKELGWTNPPPLPTSAEPFERLRQAWTFLLTLPGIPLIYYGDELGMPGAGDPDNRRMMVFGNLSAEQQHTLAHVKKLTAARHAHPAMRRGTRTQLYMESNGTVWAYGLRDGSDRVVVALNRNGTAQTRTVSLAALGFPGNATLTNVLTNMGHTLNGTELTLSIPARGAAVLVQP
jgi:glycosidase